MRKYGNKVEFNTKGDFTSMLRGRNLSSRIIGLALVATICSTVIPSVGANAATTVTPKIGTSVNVDNNRKNDEVVAYLNGQTITRKDVDKNGMITKDIHPKSNNKSNIRLDYENPDDLDLPDTLPDGYSEAYVVTGLSHRVRYNQTTTDMYLTVSDARELASKLDGSDALNIAEFLAGLFSPKPIGVMIWARQIEASSAASSIRKYTDNDEEIHFTVCTSDAGTFYHAEYWDGSTLYTDYTEDQVLESVSYN